MKISFVIPVYNAAFHLDTCLKSIRSQNFLQDGVEIILADGGSTDATRTIAGKYNCKVADNEKRLAEHGVQIGVAVAQGEFLVIFAADNELIGSDWIKRVVDVFEKNKSISAVWGRLASGKDDTALNRYFELIQSDPLNWFLNRNLKKYIKNPFENIQGCRVFKVLADKPLVWGANGLAYRTSQIKEIWTQRGYLGDNDAFQSMIERGDDIVGYFDEPFIYHHHVARLSDWVKKWKRNFKQHLVEQHNTRNMNWVFSGSFKLKLAAWSLYAACPVFSIFHSLYLMARDRNCHWLFHPLVSFVQFYTYMSIVVSGEKSRAFIKHTIFGLKS